MFGAAVGARPRFAWTWLDPGVVLGALDGVRGPVLALDPGADLAIALLTDAGGGALDREIAWRGRDDAELAVAALKVEAAAELPVEGYRGLLGLELGGRRVFLYHLIRGALSAASRSWWDQREALLREGFARCGAFERLMERLCGVGPRGVPSRVLRRLSPTVLARAAELPGVWGDALKGEVPPQDGALWRLASCADFSEAERVWPQLGRTGHAALAADRGARLNLGRATLAQALVERPWAGVVLGPMVEAGPGLARGLEALPAGCRVIAWTGQAPPPSQGMRRLLDLEGPLRARDRSLLPGLWIADRQR